MSLAKSIMSKSRGTAVLVLVFVVSLGLNVYLARARAFSHGPARVVLRVNSKLPAILPLQDADGEEVFVKLPMMRVPPFFMCFRRNAVGATETNRT